MSPIIPVRMVRMPLVWNATCARNRDVLSRGIVYRLICIRNVVLYATSLAVALSALLSGCLPMDYLKAVRKPTHE